MYGTRRYARRLIGNCVAAMLAALLVQHTPSAAAKPQAAEARASALIAAGESVFAVINDQVLSDSDYRRAYANAARERFYHARPPQGDLSVFRREVGDELIARVLVVQEARRRGLAPEGARIDEILRVFDERNRSREGWQERREPMVRAWRTQLENRSLYEQMEVAVREVAPATDAQAREYYESHREQFVEPEQVRLSLILLKVDPSAPAAAWEAAMLEASHLHARLVAGADFGEAARLRSGDAQSAARGGDMGYLHRGMLAAQIHQAIDGLAIGALSAPTRLLEGVAILRLDDRKAARDRGFDDVRQRAAELWQRDESLRRWDQMLTALRRGANLWVNEALYSAADLPADHPKASSER